MKTMTSAMSSVRNGLKFLVMGNGAASWSGMEVLEPRLLLSGVTQWTGQDNNHWDNAANWTAGVPDGTTIAVLDGTPGTNQPMLYGNAVAAGVEIRSAGWTLSISGNKVLSIGADGLSIARNTNGAPTSKIDVGAGDLVINNGTDDTELYQKIQDLIRSGQGSCDEDGFFLWDGQGITSSRAAAMDGYHLAIAVADNAFLAYRDPCSVDDGGRALSELDGVPVQTNDILVKFTAYGDVGLDGTTSLTDYCMWKFYYCNDNSGNPADIDPADIGWQTADFDMDGLCTINDYFLWKDGYVYSNLEVPDAPSGLTATVVSCNRVDLAWSDNSWNESGFIVERATDAEFTENLETMETAANVHTYTDTFTASPTTFSYYYRVRATNTAGDSGDTNTEIAAVPAQVPLVEITPSDPVNEGEELALQFTVTYPTAYSYLVDWGDGTTTQSVPCEGTTTFTENHTYQNDDPALPCVARTITVTATDENEGEGSASTDVDVIRTRPAAPLGLDATYNSGTQSQSIDLTWSAVEDAAGYNIYRGTDSDSMEQVGTVGTTPSYYADSMGEEDAGKTYLYYVTSLSAEEAESLPSNEAIANVAAGDAPDAPANVQAVGGDGCIAVTWDAVDGATSYEIWRWKPSISEYFHLAATVSAAEPLSFDDNNVMDGDSYKYAVRAIVGGTEGNLSDWSDPVTIIPPTPDITKVTYRWGSTDLVWTRSLAASGYRIYKYDSPADNATGTLVITYPSSMYYADELECGSTTNYYRVTAYNSWGESAPSSVVCPEETVPAVPNLIVNRIYDQDENYTETILTWTAVRSPSNDYETAWYHIYRNGGETPWQELSGQNWAFDYSTGSETATYSITAYTSSGLESSPTSGVESSVVVSWHNPQFTLEVDSDNDSTGYDVNGRWSSEMPYPFLNTNDALGVHNATESDSPGVYLMADTGDTDGDGIPDFADGFNLNTGLPENLQSLDDTGGGSGNIPMISMTMEGRYAFTDENGTHVATSIRFTYSASDPSDVPSPGGTGTLDDPHTWSVPTGTGSLQLWTAQEGRNKADIADGGNFIQSGVWYSVDQTEVFNSFYPWWVYGWDGCWPDTTVWAEGIKASADQAITVEIGYDNGGPIVSDTVHLTVLNNLANLSIDSDNNNGTDAPDQTPAENAIKNEVYAPGGTDSINSILGLVNPGKIIPVNDTDIDGDGVPDFADGYNRDGVADTTGASTDDSIMRGNVHEQFVPIVLTLSDDVDLNTASIRLEYDASDPALVCGKPSYQLLGGSLRLWTRPDGATNDDRRMAKPFFEVSSNDPSDVGYYVPPTITTDYTEITGIKSCYGPDDLAKLGFSPDCRSVTLYVEGVPSFFTKYGYPNNTSIILQVDPDGNGPAGFVGQDTVRLLVSAGDVEIDSDNNNSLLPDCSDIEDWTEDAPGMPGKFILVNDGDKDGDGVPDFADGYNRDGSSGNADDSNDQEYLVPMIVKIPAWADLDKSTFTFDYDASDPMGITTDNGSYLPADGHLRIWTSTDAERTADQFIQAGHEYSAEDLGYSDTAPLLNAFRNITLYVEAVRPSATLGDQSVKVYINPNGSASGDTLILMDTVRLTALQATAAGQTSGGVRYADGTVELSAADLVYAAAGTQGRTYTTQLGLSYGGLNGNDVVSSLPHLIQCTNAVIVVVGGETLYFDYNGKTDSTAKYTPRLGSNYTLTAETNNWGCALADTKGNCWYFSTQNEQPGGVDLCSGRYVGFYSDSLGRPLQATLSDGNANGRIQYEYYDDTSLPHQVQGLLKSASLIRETAGVGHVVQSVQYTYYGPDDTNGNPGDLKTVTEYDGQGTTLGITCYRYAHKDDASDPSFLTAVIGPAAYQRMLNDNKDPLTASDTDIEAYADYRFDYYTEGDNKGRVKDQWIQGTGATDSNSNTAGQFSYTYEAAPDDTEGFNVWAMKTTETLPSGTQKVVYTNFAGETMLTSVQAGSQQWNTFNQYDDHGRVVMTASPSAVQSVEDGERDLGYGGSLLKSSDGLITAYTYGTDNTAGTDLSDPDSFGDAQGYLSTISLKHGENGQPILQEELKYVKCEADVWFYETTTSRYLLASDTVYPDDSGTRSIKTWYEYSFSVYGCQFPFRPSEVITHLPAAGTDQNGSGDGATIDQVIAHGTNWVVWTKDAKGYISHNDYDGFTGAVTAHVDDLDAIAPPDWVQWYVPTGWTTPTGGGLNLATKAIYDDLGRPLSSTDPAGRVTYYQYFDGAASSTVRTSLPSGQIQEVYTDRANGYTETRGLKLVQDAGGEPTFQLISLSRDYYDHGGRIIESRQYNNVSTITGVPCDVPADYGSLLTSQNLNSNQPTYYQTLYGYDSAGRQNRVVDPTGQITRTKYDALGRVTEIYVGTDDSDWEDQTSCFAHMVCISRNQYDNDGVGDGNLTQVTNLPGVDLSGVTKMSYDWRDCLVATQSGMNPSQANYNNITNPNANLNSTIVYDTLDNLGRTTAEEVFNGNSNPDLSADTSGVPQRPSDSLNLRRAKTATDYDDLGQVFRTTVYRVKQTGDQAGALGDTLVTNYWYDGNGNLIKQLNPDGTVAKTQYDGAGRVVKQFTTDGGGDSNYADAGNVTGDTVLSEVLTDYNLDDQTLWETTWERQPDSTLLTGDISSATASTDVRTTYDGQWYDGAGRITASADFGDNNDQGLSRPSEAPTYANSGGANVTAYGYDAAGWQALTTDSKGHKTVTLHDALGRVTQTIENYIDGHASATDTAMDRITKFFYDAKNRLSLMVAIDPNGASPSSQNTEFFFADTDGDSSNDNGYAALVDPTAVTRTVYPDSTGTTDRIQYTYDDLGRTATATDQRGVVHTYTYDAASRLTNDSVGVDSLPQGVDDAIRSISYTYDSNGNQDTVTSKDVSDNPVNQIAYSYDVWGNLIGEQQAHSGSVANETPSVQYTWSDGATSGQAQYNHLTSISYPSGRTVYFRYGTTAATADQLQGISDRLAANPDGSNDYETYTYAGLSTLAAISRPQVAGGLNLDVAGSLDTLGRTAETKWTSDNGDVTYDWFTYGYDDNSNCLYRQNNLNIAMSELYQQTASAYDGLDRLTGFARGTLSEDKTAITDAGRTQAWTFDGQDNRTSITSTTGAGSGAVTRTQGLIYNTANQITSSGYAYDPAGNLTQDSNFKYTYDAWNRLVAVHKAYDDTLVAVYAYDGQGRRITKTVGDTTTHYYYDTSWRVVEEQQSVGSGDAAVTAQYLWRPGSDTPILKWTDFVDGEATRTLYYTTDAFGKVTALIDGDTGAVVERYVYDPYGAVTFLQGNQEGQTEWAPTVVEGQAPGTASAVGNEILYAGYRYDPETSLYQLRNRQYDPSTGRFLQRDPSGYNGTMNSYGYAGGNPVTASDPLGLAAGADLNSYGSYRDTSSVIYLNGGSGFNLPVAYGVTQGPGGQQLKLLKTPSPTNYRLPSDADACMTAPIVGMTYEPIKKGDGWFETARSIDATINPASWIVNGLKAVSNEVVWLLHGDPNPPVGIKTTTFGDRTAEVIGRTGSSLMGLGSLRQANINRSSNIVMDFDAGWFNGVSYHEPTYEEQFNLELFGTIQLAMASFGVRYFQYKACLSGDPMVVNTTCGWRVGGPINNLTLEGNVPSWDAVRQRIWKNEAFYNAKKYTAENLARMRQGLAPQRINKLGQIESMEFHHWPPQRQGGLFEVTPTWPSDHAAIDPFRRIGG